MSTPRLRTAGPSNSFQTTLLHYPGFRNPAKARPCHINTLPIEILMEILAYLPLGFSANTRVHINPFLLPDPDDDDVPTEEVLERIMMQEDYGNCLAEYYFLHGCSRFCFSREWNMLNILRVCKLWRAVASACPEYWVNVTIQNYDTVERSLRLSGTLPLRVGEGTSRWPSVLSLLLSLDHLPRIRTLYISCSPPNEHLIPCITHVNDYFKRHSAALLKTLWLDFSDGRDRDEWPEYLDLDTAHWIQQGFPVLEELTLDTVHLHSPCALLSPSLTELALVRCVTPWKTTEELLCVLQSLPLLKILAIMETVHPPDLGSLDSPVITDVIWPVRMRHMNLLEFQGSLICTSRLLFMLATPKGVDMDLTYEHDGPTPLTTSEIIHAYTVFDSIADAMPDDAYFSAMGFEVDFGARSMEFSFACLENPSEKLCTEKMIQKHNWSDTSRLPDICIFARRISAPFLPRTMQAKEISLNIDFKCYAGSLGLLHRSVFAWILDVTGLTHLILDSDAAKQFIPWMVGLICGAGPNNDGVLAKDMHVTSEQLRQPLPLPGLTRLGLRNCNMAHTVREDCSDPADILFLHFWIYLHAQKPCTQLVNVECSNRMLKELERLLGPQLDYCSGWEACEVTRIHVRRSLDDSMEELTLTVGREGLHRTRISVARSDVVLS